MQKEQTILEWYRENYKWIDAPCNGKGTCGKCKVQFLKDAPQPQQKENQILTKEELENGIRLACVTKMDAQNVFVPIGDIGNREMTPIAEKTNRLPMGEETYHRAFGAVIDIGTTTIVLKLVSLPQKVKETAEHECLTFPAWTTINRQRAYGADVISRIEAANQGKLKEMQTCVLQDIFALLKRAAEEEHILLSQVKKLVIAGNTTMCHILLGYSCEGLGKAPFLPVHLSFQKYSVKDLLLSENDISMKKEFAKLQNAEVIIFPGISAFLGADIVAGMYACDMDWKEEPCMLLDVGTNGEMVVGNKNHFYGASAAAGPVFEGGNISCGMPAVTGAVFRIQKGVCDVIGGKAAKGICGSGLVDLTSFLWKEQFIDENGTFIEEYFEQGYPIQHGMADAPEGIRLTQADIREIQMGKAAIRAGIEILMQKQKPNEIYLAGGFGTAINQESACTIGLLPKHYKQRIKEVDNVVIKGLEKFLTDPDGEMRVNALAQNVEEVVLAKQLDFEEKYIHFMQFLI